MATVHRDTAHSVKIDGHWYDMADGDVVAINQLGIFERKFTVGDASADSDDYLSSLIMRDFSGGIGIEDSDEGADTTRFWFGVIDSRSPKMLAPPPKVTQVAGPQAGACRPLGVVGTQFYCAFDNDVYGWKDSTSEWHVTANALGGAPVNKPVAFDGRVWIPLGSNGIDFVTESNASNGTLTVDTSRATPEAAALAIYDNILYAIATDGDLWQLAVGSTTWGAVNDSSTTQLRLHQGETPKNLVTYFDRSGAPTLWVITDQSAYMFDTSAIKWRQSNIKFPPHPDFGRSVAVWRPGEDLWIAAATDVVRQTTGNSIVPLSSGLSRDQGLPQQYRGIIQDLIPEISHLYALVGGVSDVATGAYIYDATIGTSGSGDSNFDGPNQVAISPADGSIYVADTANNRLKKHDNAGTYVSQITSLTGITGVCVDASGNVYIARQNGADATRTKYNSSHVQQWTSTSSISLGTAHVATDGTSFYFVNPNADLIAVRACSDGSGSTSYGGSGTGNGQFDTPYGIATDGTHLYIVDQGNSRVQKLTVAGAYVTQWGSSGSGDGQFQTPTGIAINPNTGNIFVTDTGRDDVQEFSPTGAFIRRFGSSGSSNGQFLAPTGIAFTSDGTSIYVADSTNDELQEFASQTGGALSAYPTLHAWTGTGWHCLWAKSVTDYVPTWGVISAPTTHYRLWWGMSDEDAYYMDLRRTFYNPLQGFQAGLDHFADTGFLLTSKFDAGMLGFDKLASHMTFFPHSASTDETITIEFSIDDGGWELLGVVNAKRKWNFTFGSGGNSKGRVFNTIQFRFTFERGSVDTLAALYKAATLLFVKIPQNARSQVFPILLPKGDTNTRGSASAQSDRLDALNDSREFFDIEYGGKTYEHCRIAGITGYDQTSDGGGQRNVNIIWIPVEAD